MTEGALAPSFWIICASYLHLKNPCLELNVSIVLSLQWRILRGWFRAPIKWAKNLCCWNQMLPARWYFYGGVNEKRRKIETKGGMELLYGILDYYKTAGHDKYLWAVDCESEIFQLKGSIDTGKLESKILWVCFCFCFFLFACLI